MSKNNENKLVPKLRFPEFTKGGNWAKKKLGVLGEFTGGGTPSRSNNSFWEGDIPWVSSSDLDDNSIYYLNISRFISEEALKVSATKKVPANSILLVSRVGVGKLAITYKQICTSQDFTNFTPTNDDLIFLAYSLKTQKEVLLGFSQGMAIKGFTKDDISNLVINLPSIDEQKEIAACLSSLDDFIFAETEKLNVLKLHKAGTIQQLLPLNIQSMQKIRFPQFENTKSWKETTLGEIADYENGKAHEQDIDDSGEFVVVNSKFISSDGEVKKFTNTPFCLANKGDILMVLSDVPNGKAIAKCFLVEEDNQYTVNQRICRITPRNLNSKILYYLLNRNPYFLAFDDGVKQTNLRKEDVLNCPLMIPEDPKEQEKIADTLSSIDDLIIAQNQKLETLQLHKKGLLQGLFPNVNEVRE